MEILINGMIYLGSFIMLYNIYGFILFSRRVKAHKGWQTGSKILTFPIILLTLFLAGYLAVAIFGNPDLIISSILLGGSIFVFVIYLLLDRITKRIIENERLEAGLMAAKESDRAKTDFLSGISHEMRTPMNVILGQIKLSLCDESLSADTRNRLEKTELSAKYLLSIINNILDINSIETGEFIAKNDPFMLEDSVEQISAIIETQCAEKGLEYTFNMSEAARGKYIGDDRRIKQILINILDNAVKYTNAPGKVDFNVDVGEKADGKQSVIFTFKDTGIGIDKDFLPMIFETFAREDTSKTSSYGGSGLGLAVTKSIIDLLDGTINVKSEKGVGSEFTVVLPLKIASEEEDTIPHGVDSLKGRRILIAEDIMENAEIVADLLELEGAESEHAENGRVAVDMFLANPAGYYDAILMDLRMPIQDGISAAREIRSSLKNDAETIPIIALTANALESDVMETVSAGMNAHLAKPADSDKLYNTLKKYIRKK